jgi:hypothetical protein
MSVTDAPPNSGFGYLGRPTDRATGETFERGSWEPSTTAQRHPHLRHVCVRSAICPAVRRVDELLFSIVGFRRGRRDSIDGGSLPVASRVRRVGSRSSNQGPPVPGDPVRTVAENHPTGDRPQRTCDECNRFLRRRV